MQLTLPLSLDLSLTWLCVQDVHRLAAKLHKAGGCDGTQAALLGKLRAEGAEACILALLLELWALRMSLTAALAAGELQETLTANKILFKFSSRWQNAG